MAAVAHPAAGVELRHRRIHARQDGESCAPGLLVHRVVLQWDAFSLGPVSGLGQSAQSVRRLLVGLAPHQLLLPRSDCGWRLLGSAGAC